MNNSNVPKLNKLKKDDLLKRDVFGRTIVNIVILADDVDSLRLLTRNPDFKTILPTTDFENGWNCLHYIIFHKRIKCLKVLVDYIQRISIRNNLFHPSSPLMELLRCKDRCGNSPLHLLDNDFKDLLWIPEFIDEKQGFNLTYRYEDQCPALDEENNDMEGSEITVLNRRCLKSSRVEWSDKRGGSEVYVLGCNSNNQLGVGDATDRSTPTMLSHNNFKTPQQNATSISDVLQQPRYKQMAISKNHSLVVTQDGRIFSCGIGSRGRLGHGMNDMSNYFKFHRIDFFHDMVIKDAAISNNHSVVLTSHNQVYAWGLNSFNQLGVPNNTSSKKKNTHYLDNFVATPTLVSGELRNAGSSLQGVAVSKIHTVAWTKNALYFWGLNVGQMGIVCTHGDIEVKLHDESMRGEIQASPKMVSLRDEIKYVSTHLRLTCVVTTLNDIHVFYNYQHYKLPKIPIKGYSDKHFDLFKPRRITEAAMIKKVVTRGPYHTMILLSSGSVLSFALNTKDIKSTKYVSVWKAYDRDMVVVDIDVSSDGSVVLCTRSGSVYIKSVVSSQRKNSMSATTLPIAVTKNKFKKIENVNKVVKVVTFDFLSFGFIRDDIDLLPLRVPKNDFFIDIESLSPVIDFSSSRKQQELLDFDRKTDRYMTSFLYPKINDVKGGHGDYGDYYDYNDDDVKHQQHQQQQQQQYFQITVSDKTSIIDRLNKKYSSKHDARKNKPVAARLTYSSQSQEELATMVENFNSFGEESLALLLLKENEITQEKGFNAFVEFETVKDIRIGFHREIFAARSPVFQKLLDLNDKDEELIGDGFKAIWIPEVSTLKVLTKVHLLSMLLVIHSVYIGAKFDIVQHFGSRHRLQDRMKSVNDEYNSLCNLFEITRGSESVVAAFDKLVTLAQGDVTLNLSDGEIRAYSYILKSRSAYFETVLSDRWNNDNDTRELDFSRLSKFQMTVILRHLYGVSNESLLNGFVGTTKDRDAFINELLEILQICDELLLDTSFLQAALSDMISLENVVTLTIHSQYLLCEMVFYNCCWYMYNNLEVLVFDSAFLDMPPEILEKVESQFQFLSNCKLVDHKPINDGFLGANKNTISEFVSDFQAFNRRFMSDQKGCSSFEPLIDNVYAELLKPKEQARKRKSRKSSNARKEILEFRESLIREKVEESLEQEVVDENAGFTIVAKKTKQKSPSPMTGEPPLVVSHVKSDIQNESNRTNSVIQSSIGTSNGLSPFSNWASVSSSSSVPPVPTVPPTPSVEPSTVLTTSNSSTTIQVPTASSKPKVPKMKIGPVTKVSQKERKRLAASAAAAASAAGSSGTSSTADIEKPVNASPWSAQTTKTSSPVNLKIKDLPVLGSSGKKKPTPVKKPAHSMSTSEVYSPVGDHKPTSSSYPSPSTTPTPSLADVMMQESFAKWWEEESRRVQQEMNPPIKNKKSQPKPKTKVRVKNRSKTKVS